MTIILFTSFYLIFSLATLNDGSYIAMFVLLQTLVTLFQCFLIQAFC